MSQVGNSKLSWMSVSCCPEVETWWTAFSDTNVSYNATAHSFASEAGTTVERCALGLSGCRSLYASTCCQNKNSSSLCSRSRKSWNFRRMDVLTSAPSNLDRKSTRLNSRH